MTKWQNKLDFSRGRFVTAAAGEVRSRTALGVCVNLLWSGARSGQECLARECSLHLFYTPCALDSLRWWASGTGGQGCGDGTPVFAPRRSQSWISLGTSQRCPLDPFPSAPFPAHIWSRCLGSSSVTRFLPSVLERIHCWAGLSHEDTEGLWRTVHPKRRVWHSWAPQVSPWGGRGAVLVLCTPEEVRDEGLHPSPREGAAGLTSRWAL